MRNHFRSAMHQVRNGFLFSVIYYDFSLHTVVFILFCGAWGIEPQRKNHCPVCLSTPSARLLTPSGLSRSIFYYPATFSSLPIKSRNMINLPRKSRRTSSSSVWARQTVVLELFSLRCPPSRVSVISFTLFTK